MLSPNAAKHYLQQSRARLISHVLLVSGLRQGRTPPRPMSNAAVSLQSSCFTKARGVGTEPHSDGMARRSEWLRNGGAGWWSSGGDGLKGDAPETVAQGGEEMGVERVVGDGASGVGGCRVAGGMGGA
ncbi:hypothetical protein DM860_007843 [Cuscuta australis]|uniref:Uncharacterized protein n=1 Tax=Cuscuta australis TaxID=267555 RepID=A0A328E0M4_9ASTE|nr:hypothetical protein DM860_007843 [Cuscuta australis]